jgi:2-oxoglutarate dehydrogenase E1 component
VQAEGRSRWVQTGAPINQADVKQATRDSVRAIMMIRAYRMRGHLHAKLDPLGIAAPVEDYQRAVAVELRLHRCRLRPQDLHRQRARPRICDRSARCSISSSAPIARRSASSSCTFPIRKRRPGSRNASKARTRASISRRKARRPSCQKLIEAEGFEQFIDVKYKGTKRFGLDGGESLIPALEQIIKRGGQLGSRKSCSAWPIAAV